MSDKHIIYLLNGAYSSPKMWHQFRDILYETFTDKVEVHVPYIYAKDGPIKSAKQLENMQINTVIGYSLGGIVGTMLKANSKCDNLITISAPLGGLSQFHPIFSTHHGKTLYADQKALMKYKNIDYGNNFYGIVTPNDKFIPFASQVANPFQKHFPVNAHHFSVYNNKVTHNYLISRIKEFVQNS